MSSGNRASGSAAEPSAEEAQDIRARLSAFLAAQLPNASLQIENLRRTGLGRSRENWTFDLVCQSASEQISEPLILRRDPLGGLVETDRVREFEVITALEPTSVPAPVGRWLDATGSWFDRPSMIMRREPGECDYYVLSSSRPLQERVALAQKFCDLLAEVHTLRWRQTRLAELLPDPGEAAASVELDRWEAVLRQDRLEPYPEIDDAARWLRANAPGAKLTTLVHGDFKPGNILIEGRRVVALLDWELAHLGDPIEDLGWVTQPLRQREHVIEGSWENSAILSRYERATGISVDPTHLAWWNAFATFRTAVMQVSGQRAFLEGHISKSYRPSASVLRSLREATRG